MQKSTVECQNLTCFSRKPRSKNFDAALYASVRGRRLPHDLAAALYYLPARLGLEGWGAVMVGF
jgi:hypothetical protein